MIIRSVTKFNRCLGVVIPKDYAVEMGLQPKDKLSIRMYDSKTLVLEKVEQSEMKPIKEDLTDG